VRGGIDLGGTKIQAVVVDDDSKVLAQARVPTPTDGGPADVSEAMAGALRTAAHEAGTGTAELSGVGVGSPGAVDEGTARSPARATSPAGREPSRSARTWVGGSAPP
jgi:glucokinase